jgi:hypothetical protein
MSEVGIEHAGIVLRALKSEEEAYNVENPVLNIFSQSRKIVRSGDVQQ